MRFKYQSIKFKILLLSIYLLLVCIYVFKMSISPSVILLLILLIFIFGNRSEILAITMSTIPLSTSIQYIYVLLLCICIYTIKYFYEIKITRNVYFLISLLLFVFIEILHWSESGYQILDSIRTLIPVFFLFFVACIDLKKVDYIFIVNVVSFTTIIICLILLLNLLISVNYNLTLLFSSNFRFGYMQGGTGILDATFNPNSLAIITLIPLIAKSQIMTYTKSKWFDYIEEILLLFFGTITLSRTYFLCLFSYILLVFFYKFHKKNINIKKLITWLLTFSFVLVLFLTFFPNICSRLIGRFFVTDISNGRNEIFVKYMSFLFSNIKVFFIGVGSRLISKKAYNYGILAVPHNGLQEVAIAVGSIGLMCIIFILISLYFSAKKKNKYFSFFNSILFYIILLKIQAGQFISSGPTFVMLALSYITMLQNMNRGVKI